jgi:hypothetical protein
MGKLFFCLLFMAGASSMEAQARPVIVIAPHIEAPIAIHVPQVNLPHVQSFANTQQNRSLYSPLDNNPLVNPPVEQVKPAPRVQIAPAPRKLPLGTTVESADRTAVNGYTIGEVRQVQQALHRLGYYNGDIDGDFGPNTQTALQRYQVSSGQPVTGTLTLGVLARLGVNGR